MDHADPAGDGFPGVMKTHRLTFVGDGAFVGRNQAVKHLHQGALAGSVFSDDRVDLPLAEFNRNMIQRRHIWREDLYHVLHRDQVCHRFQDLF